MWKVSLIRLVAIATLMPFAATAATDPAPADPPSPGERCPTLRAVTQDSHGHTMWCIHMIDGPTYQVWQYTGVS